MPQRLQEVDLMASVPDLFSLKGKIALVTAGAGRYGKQLVQGLAEAGATTITASRDINALNTLAETIKNEHDVDIHTFQYDQSDEASILKLRDDIKEKFGRCDIFVNNAAAQCVMKDGHLSPAGEFAESMQINATGIFTIARAFGELMKENGEGGSIINIGSIHGMIAPDEYLYANTEITPGFFPDYFFVKGGMISLSRYLASYYGKDGIRCNTVSPGGYKTDAHTGQFETNYNQRTLLNRMAGDDDLKGVVAFLASDAAAYITGANIPVDGGYTVK